MKALRTGRVTSDAFFGDGALAGGVVLHAGIGELSVPLSPETIMFPRSVDQLPVGLTDPARRLLGLAWSIAKSPDGAPPAGLPRVGEQATRWRIDDLILAARHRGLGEDESTALSDFTLGWLNAGAEKSVGFDQLRRASVKGSELAAAWGAQLTLYWQSEVPYDFQKRIATSLPERKALTAVLSSGTDPANPSARLVLAGRTIAGQALLFPGEAGYRRTLPSAELYRASPSGTQYEVGWIGSPDAGGYQLQILGKRTDSVTLTVTYPGAGGKLVFVSFGPIAVSSGSSATVDLIPGIDPSSLAVVGASIGSVAGSLQIQPRAELKVIAAVQDLEADPRGHAVSLLFNRVVNATVAADKSHYEVRSPSGVNTTVVMAPQGGDPRRVILGVTNHPSPYTTPTVRADQLTDGDGIVMSPAPQIVNLDVRDRTPGGSVDGVVIGANGQPVPNAVIVVRMPAISDITGQTFQSDFASTTADSSGHFFFEYVAVRQGAIFQVFAADPATGFDGDAFGQVRSEGERVTLNVVLLGRGDVGGKVVDETGAPVPNAYVQAESVFFKYVQGRASTNAAADGTYLVKSLPIGAVQLFAIDPASRKFAYQVASIPTAGGTVTQDIVIVRTPRASISGDVIHERDGKPAAGLYIVAYGELPPPQTPGDRKYFGYRVTDASGRFSFQITTDSSTVIHLVELEPQTHYGSVQGTVKLSNGSTGTPLPNVVVSVSDTPWKATTDATGHYRIDYVPVGAHKVTAYDPGTKRSKVADAAIQEGLALPLDIIFDPVATPWATIRGVVLDPLDRPVPGAAVAEFEFDDCGEILRVVRSAIADATGHYLVTDVPQGGHTFHALGRDDASGTMEDDVGSASINYDALGEGSLTIRLLGWGTVRGKVVGSHLDDNGNPIDSPLGVRVRLGAPKLGKLGQFGAVVVIGGDDCPSGMRGTSRR